MLISRRKWLLAGGALIAVAAFAGLGVAALDNDQPDGSPVAYSPSRGVPPGVVSGSADEIIRALAERLPHVVNPRLVTADIPSEDGASSGKQGLFLEYDLAATSFDSPATVEPTWEGMIFTGAVRDSFAARSLPAISGADATLVRPDGTRRAIGGGFGRSVTDQVFDNAPSDLQKAVAARAGALGLTGAAVEVMKGLQDVVVIRATTTSPAKTVPKLVDSNPGLDLLGTVPTSYEGTLVEIDNEQGIPVFIVGTAPRAAAGIRWVDPSLGIQMSR